MKCLLFSSIDPYQILFPLGLIHAIVGALVWILFALNMIHYPGQIHPHYMIDGFLISFAAGFMLTAIPRFTGTESCSRQELLSATVLSVLALFIPHPVITLLMLILISGFFIKRLLTRSFSPPPHFLFLPIGLFLGILGSTLMIFGNTSPGKVFLYYGTMLSFLLGIGAKLISALLGFVEQPSHQIEMAKTSNTGSNNPLLQKWLIPVTQATLFLLGFFIEVSIHPILGRGLIATCATWIGFQNWHLYRLPKTSGKMPFWMWISAWMLMIGLWTHSLFPTLGIHAAHLIFMSGFGLTTLLVASRVTLAHGGYSLNLETTSRIFPITATLILLATLTRFSSLWTSSLIQHFAYAAALWILALIFWISFFLPKMIPKLEK